MMPSREPKSGPHEVHDRRAGDANHPADVLLEEHLAIHAVLDAMQAEADRLAAGALLRQRLWLRVVDFLERFADRYHHVRVEELLPALRARGLLERDVDTFRREHSEYRALRECLKDLDWVGARSQVLESLRALVPLLRQHLERERRLLMRASELPRLAADELLVRVVRKGRELLDEEAFHDLIQLAREICAEAGVAFPARYSPFGGAATS